MTSTRRAPRADDVITLAASLLLRTGRSGAGERLMVEHSPDGTGHCRGCSHSNKSAPVHPCRLRLVGEAIGDLTGRSSHAPAGDQA